MAKEFLKVSRRPIIVQGRAYGPGVHTVDDKEVSRLMRSRGAIRVTSDDAEQASELPTKKVESVEDLTGPIPGDFPYNGKLGENGVTTFDQLAALNREDLTAMEGIGEATADRILQALQEAVDDANESD